MPRNSLEIVCDFEYVIVSSDTDYWDLQEGINKLNMANIFPQVFKRKHISKRLTPKFHDHTRSVYHDV